MSTLCKASLNEITQYFYDGDGDLTSLVHNNLPATFADYTWTYDLGGRVLTLANEQHAAEDLTYSYDHDNQLVGASGTSSESYGYDANGNRTSADNTNGSHTYSAPSDNEVSDDGTNTYQYDADGNLIKSTSDATSSYIVYAYDNRNRLVEVDNHEEDGTETQQVIYTYDVFNNLIGRSIQQGTGTTVTHQQFIYDDPADNGQMVLAFQTTGSTTPTTASLTDRYLWGQAVDQILADEKATGVSWLLTDNQGTIRDVALYNATTNTTTVADHITYDSYGQPLSHSADGSIAAAVDTVFGYTGKFYDSATKLQWNVNRWYNPETGTWMSQDPIGFAGGQANLSEYVGDDPTNFVDPTGLDPIQINNGQVSENNWWFPNQPIGTLGPDGKTVTRNGNTRSLGDVRNQAGNAQWSGEYPGGWDRWFKNRDSTDPRAGGPPGGGGGGAGSGSSRKPGTQTNPDGTPKNPMDQLDQIKKAQKRGKLIESTKKSEQNVKKYLKDVCPDE